MGADCGNRNDGSGVADRSRLSQHRTYRQFFYSAGIVAVTLSLTRMIVKPVQEVSEFAHAIADRQLDTELAIARHRRDR